jgi:hypothetical protein
MVMKALRALAILVCLGFSALAQTAASTEDLIKHVLAAIETNSQTDLERLTISEAEYRKYIWPTISANNPVAKFENYYAMYRQGSIYGLTMLLKGLGGQKLQLVKVSPGQLIRQGKGYRLLSTPIITVRTESGAEKSIKVFGAVLENDSSSKVSTYFVREDQTAN